MMRVLLGVALFCGGALLVGCPVYSNDRYCNGNGCYDCPSGSNPSNGSCIPWACGSSADCASGYVCDTNYACVPAPVDAGGCGPCPSGYVCKLAGGIAQCTPGAPAYDAGRDASPAPIDASAGGPPDASADARSDGAIPDASSAADVVVAVLDAGHVPDAGGSDATPAPDAPAIASCNANSDCGLDGSKCIDGRCTAEAELCSDTTQCVVAGEACVDGVCVPHCSSNAPCPAGYACDFTRGVCDLNPSSCAGSGASTCVGGSVCVEGRCLAPCGASDAGPRCPAGQICVNGGCMPDEAARFACKNDGQGGLLANECDDTQICVHHSCYAACDPDGGVCADPSQSCKQVTVSAGTYAVCGSASNLGSQCDLATGHPCTTGVCVDGYCR